MVITKKVFMSELLYFPEDAQDFTVISDRTYVINSILGYKYNDNTFIRGAYTMIWAASYAKVPECREYLTTDHVDGFSIYREMRRFL